MESTDVKSSGEVGQREKRRSEYYRGNRGQGLGKEEVRM